MKVSTRARRLAISAAAALTLAATVGAAAALAADPLAPDATAPMIVAPEDAVTAEDATAESAEAAERQVATSGQAMDVPFRSDGSDVDVATSSSTDGSLSARAGGRVCVDPRKTYVGSDITRAYFRQYETCLRVSGDRFYVESTVLYRGTHGRNKPPKFDAFRIYAIVVGSSGYSVAQATCNSIPRASDAFLHYDSSNVWWTWDHHPLRCSGYIGDGKARSGRQYQLHSFIRYDVDGDGRGTRYTSRQRSAYVQA